METTLGVKIDPVDAKRGAAAVIQAVDDIRGSARGLRGDLFDTFSSRAVLAGGIVTGLGVVASGLISTTRAAAAYISEIKDFTQHTSVAAREASALAYAAGQNGTSVQDLQRGLQRLNQNMAEAVNGTGDSAQLFRALGLSVTETDGRLRATADTFLDVVHALGRFRDDGAKNTLVAKLLGEQMQDMARAGRDAIVEQTREAEKLGLVIGGRDVDAAEALDKAMDRLNKTFLGVTVQVGKELIPTMTEAVDLFSHMGGGAVSGALGFVHDRLVGLNVLMKELQANSRFLFGKGQDALSFDQLRKSIDDIESEGQRKKLLFEHPTALDFMPPPRRPTDGRPALDFMPPPRRPTDGRPGLPSMGTEKERSVRLDAEHERRSKAITDELDLTRGGFSSMSRLYDFDAQRQIVSQEDVVEMKGKLRLKDIEAQGESLNRQLELEHSFYERRVRMGFESTQERIAAEERFRSKVFDINQGVRKVEAEYARASQQIEAEKDVARRAAESALGQRLEDNARSQYEIREAVRQRDFDAQQTYSQGELDMAQARFASDQEIAQKERDMLREQLAFKLRLTREELDRIMVLRQTGNTDLANARLARNADPALPQAAREGILESGSARDIRLMERANGDFFSGWERGLQKYAQDRDSAFGMSMDMARQTAQAMNQGFQNLFFDAMEGKFKGFKDVLAGVLKFTMQMIAQITAQLVTMKVIDLATSASGAFGGIPGRNVSGVNVRAGKFATGGSFMVPGFGGTDTQPVGFMATPGERVTVETPDQQRRGGGNTVINITVNASGGSQGSAAGAPPNMSQLARDLGKLVEAKLIEEQRPGGLLAGASA